MFELEYTSYNLHKALINAFDNCEPHRDEFITPEHLLWAIGWQPQFMMVTGDAQVTHLLTEYFMNHGYTVPEGVEYTGAKPSHQFIEMVNHAYEQMSMSNAHEIDVPHILQGILSLSNSYAHDLLVEAAQGNMAEFMSQIVENYSDPELGRGDPIMEELDKYLEEGFNDDSMPQSDDKWRQYVTCLNDHIDDHNPLIGRERELERTIQVLCRKDKNNPLHVGEPGVGKTALAYGLAVKIERGDVPERLLGSKVYMLDLGSLIAGTQYRGEFEKRLKMVLKGVAAAGKSILYIDEIHNVVGAGRVEGSTLDASNLIKAHLETGDLRFMGATTYEEYNRVFRTNKAFARRFEKIDILEPSVDETIQILQGLKGNYESYHGIEYTAEAIEYAARAAEKYITGRYLPDKAIDLIDEAGAWRELHPAENNSNVVDKKLVAEVLSKICQVDMLAEDRDDAEKLMDLKDRIKALIYGQDQAVDEVTEAVQMATAGLIDDNKPMASLLFVGPTGVGKTEVAKVLAQQLAIPLVRFDMSEYAEKHTVAKLIGSPAGYVGYDDGGLLTDAVRKSPNCVLLLDELEKAHPDIFNILLQVMDYAVLTDNKGQKADFRHVVLIMTTNAGAQEARQGNVGFTRLHSSSQTMMKSVKRTFKPEFLNRLTAVTMFRDMDQTMAQLILKKKLAQLEQKLAAKNVTLQLTDRALQALIDEGFSAEYGGREIDRVLSSRLKPLLTRAILFGPLRNGGLASVDIDESNNLTLR